MAGVNLNDRKLASEVRQITLKKIKKLFELESLSDKERELHDALLIRLAGSVLPRLNELTGEDGEAVKLQLISYANAPISVPTETVPDSTPESV